MSDNILTFSYVLLPWLAVTLFVLPILYFALSYIYLALWHHKYFLFGTLVHENGRLTLFDSLFYFDHFVACIPMITVFALSTAGGFALTAYIPSGIGTSCTAFVATVLLGGSVLLILVAFLLSIYKAGWRRTIDYALQRTERDGVMSRGGNWNQLQLSNIPIALGTIGVSSTLAALTKTSDLGGNISLATGGLTCLTMAVILSSGIKFLNWPGWQSFLNPRWLAHSIREIAAYPLTGIPIALSSVVLVESCLSGLDTMDN